MAIWLSAGPAGRPAVTQLSGPVAVRTEVGNAGKTRRPRIFRADGQTRTADRRFTKPYQQIPAGSFICVLVSGRAGRYQDGPAIRGQKCGQFTEQEVTHKRDVATLVRLRRSRRSQFGPHAAARPR